MNVADNLPIAKTVRDYFPTDHDLTITLHAGLDGSDGANRNRSPGAVLQINANTDLEAIEVWLKAKKRKSPNTCARIAVRRTGCSLGLSLSKASPSPV